MSTIKKFLAVLLLVLTSSTHRYAKAESLDLTVRSDQLSAVVMTKAREIDGARALTIRDSLRPYIQREIKTAAYGLDLLRRKIRAGDQSLVDVRVRAGLARSPRSAGLAVMMKW
jgi:hypothetical protein